MDKPPPTSETSTSGQSPDIDKDAAADAALLADPRALTILSTEHWSLLSARSLAYNESFTRANMYLAFLSMSFVGLALLAQATGFDTAFLGIAALVLGFDLLIGVLTIMRMVLAANEDVRATLGMNRIRNGYVRIAPTVERFFVTGVTDDPEGILKTATLGKRPESIGAASALSTSGAMVAFITGLVAGTLAATVALLFALHVGVALAIGAGATLVFVAGVMVFGVAQLRRDQATFESRFPARSN